MAILPVRSRRVLRNVRQSVPSGVVLGRRSQGFGPAEYIPLDEVTDAQLDAITATRGSILYRGASGWVGLAPGTSGYHLRTNGAGADPTWEAVSAGGGGLEFDARYSATAQATNSGQQFDFPTSYDVIRVDFGIQNMSLNNTELRFQFTKSTTPVTSGYQYSLARQEPGTTIAESSSTSAGHMRGQINGLGNNTGECIFGTLEIHGAEDSGLPTFMEVRTLQKTHNPVYDRIIGHGVDTANQAVDGLKIFSNVTGTWDIYANVYGYKKS